MPPVERARFMALTIRMGFMLGVLIGCLVLGWIVLW
jgi:hypothetical protein